MNFEKLAFWCKYISPPLVVSRNTFITSNPDVFLYVGPPLWYFWWNSLCLNVKATQVPRQIITWQVFVHGVSRKIRQIFPRPGPQLKTFHAGFLY